LFSSLMINVFSLKQKLLLGIIFYLFIFLHFLYLIIPFLKLRTFIILFILKNIKNLVFNIRVDWLQINNSIERICSIIPVRILFVRRRIDNLISFDERERRHSSHFQNTDSILSCHFKLLWFFQTHIKYT
jgi:hypothetical protein